MLFVVVMVVASCSFGITPGEHLDVIEAVVDISHSGEHRHKFQASHSRSRALSQFDLP